MKHRKPTLVLLALTLLALLAPAPAALAQANGAPDLRDILPYMMLVVDTSGSMERLPACQCVTPACSECLPDCSLANDAMGDPPVSAEGRELKKNRWAVTLEALTGQIQDFECEPLARSATNGMTYDLGYYLPYHQPWDCAAQASGTACARMDTGTTCVVDSDCSSLNYPRCDTSVGHCTAFRQQQNGILDTYATRVRFGLMAFDGWDTYPGAPPLVSVETFDEPLSDSEQGLWSYADPQTFHYPNCTTDYMMDTGARSADADEGQLISLNSCDNALDCPSWCPSCPLGNNSMLGPSNTAIQDTLIRARPYGGTPIAAALDDLYYHLTSDLTDTFGACRNRFAMLITDGYPDDDYRSYGCNCANEEPLSDPNRCGGNGCVESDPNSCANHPSKMHCPYPRPEEVAYDLVAGRDGGDPQLEKVYVVGLAVDDTATIARLNAIAEQGGVEDVDGDGNAALFANDLDQLLANLAAVIDDNLAPVSRSVPAFASGGTSSRQYQISTGFQVATGTGQPWTGIIERRRFECSGGVLQEDIAVDDLDDVVSTQGATRTLYTVVPDPSDRTKNNADIHIGSTDCPSQTDCDVIELSSANVGAAHLQVPDGPAVDGVVDWLKGASTTPRNGKAMGDIYHSAPVMAGTPQFDTSDEAFNLFRISPMVRDRPLVMYFGTNDGILHAISVEDYSAPSSPTYPGAGNLSAGSELWGFVPPLFLDRIKDNLNTHQFMMDGVPVVKNVYFNKDTTAVADPTTYHTVVVAGMRGGGNGYVALDVTNPFQPHFLWQFTRPEMGYTYAQAAIVQARFATDPLDPDNSIKNGAVAIIPGGTGDLDTSMPAPAECEGGVTNDSMRQGSGLPYFSYVEDPLVNPGGTTAAHRGAVRCWRPRGRALYFVDVENGKLIKEIRMDGSAPLLPSPMVGSPAMYQTDTGTLASHGFVVDADGVIWRIDMSATDPQPTLPRDGWTVRPFHDIFYDIGVDPNTSVGPAYRGELTYEAPVLSVDDNGRLVVIVGTGDNDNFIKPNVNNRVVSLREVRDDTISDETDPERFKAFVNWEERVQDGGSFVTSELVTGTMGLFNGQLFFATFIPVSGSGNACDLGRGRVHAVDYIKHDAGTSYPSGTYGPLRLTSIGGDTEAQGVINIPAASAIENFMVMGLGVTQRPTCSIVDPEGTDVYGNTISGVTALSEPAIYLVAQASGEASEIAQRAGSALGSIELRLNKPVSVSRVTSWATTVE